MSDSRFQMDSFTPKDGLLVIQSEERIGFSFSSAFVADINVELKTDEDNGVSYSKSQETQTDGQNDISLIFDGFPPSMNLHYVITVTGEKDNANTVSVYIEW